MPQTACPKLRRVRELLLEEQVAKVDNQRAERRQDAIDKWRNAPAKSGNQAFFQLGVDLRNAGVAMSDIEATLWHESSQARHPVERRAEITGIVRTLRQGNRRTIA